MRCPAEDDDLDPRDTLVIHYRSLIAQQHNEVRSHLAQEFGVSRPTVVRAMETLRQQGWVDAQHGKGRTVREWPVAESRALPAHTTALLNATEVGDVTILQAGEVAAPPCAAAALRLPEGTTVVARRRLMRVDGVGPVELSTVYVPTALAADSDVAAPEPLAGGVLSHLADRAGVTLDHVVERVSARIATAEEKKLLELPRRDPLLTLLKESTTTPDFRSALVR